jgi:hypothetical protein
VSLAMAICGTLTRPIDADGIAMPNTSPSRRLSHDYTTKGGARAF